MNHAPGNNDRTRIRSRRTVPAPCSRGNRTEPDPFMVGRWASDALSVDANHLHQPLTRVRSSKRSVFAGVLKQGELIPFGVDDHHSFR
jgi:hypothetical protein